MNYFIDRAHPTDRQGILDVLKHFNMHHVPSVEMEELNTDSFFVARCGGRIVGVAGYKLLSASEGKTTLMGVLPDYGGFGIGKELQHIRMEAMHRTGVKTLTTNADRPETIVWYKKHFGYREVGTLQKRCSFGLEEVDHWTTLETNLDTYFADLEQRERFKQSYMAQYDAYPLTPYPPLLINVCLTGMIPTKIQTPHVPTTCDEIIEDAIACYDAGARIVHLHARDESGVPTPEVGYYERIIRGIRRERPGMICGVTTSGRNWPDYERRSQVLYLDEDCRPDMASLTTGSLNFLTGPSANSIHIIERLAIAMKEQQVKPELEVFDTGMVNMIKYLERNQLIQGIKYVNILLGNLNTAPATIGSLAHMVELLPDNSVWSGTGIGQFQLPMNVASIVAGGHVRVGLEDAIHYDYARQRLATNKDLVERIVRMAEEMQRPIATAVQARMMLGLRVHDFVQPEKRVKDSSALWESSPFAQV